MIFLQVEGADLLTPLVALAGSLIGAVVTLSVAMLRFGLGKAGNPGGITHAQLHTAVSSITKAIGEAATGVKGEVSNVKGEVAGVRGEVSGLRGQLGGFGETMGRIEGKLHSHGNPGGGPPPKPKAKGKGRGRKSGK